MSHVLILVGSVRRNGNTQALAQACAEGARAAGHQVEIVSVADYHVHPCIGCEGCSQHPENQCVQQDDMQKLYPQLNLADIIVFASPLYFYGLSAQLKAVIDRFYPLTKDDKLPAFDGKQCVLLLCGASEDEDDFEGAIRTYELICDYAGWEDCGVVSACGVTNPGDVKGTVWMDEVEALAGQF